jgi:HEAT repeat protein
MTTHETEMTAAAAVTLASVSVTRAATAGELDEFIGRMKSADDKVRGPAWQGAGTLGAPAVRPLAGLMADANFEVARCAKRTLYLIVRHAGRPGASKEAQAVERELISVLKSGASAVQREVAWMLSEIGGNDAVAAIAVLLSDKEAREDARCALTRIPGRKAVGALKSAFAAAPEDFKFALAESLRQRGETVAGYPSQKLVPTRATTVSQPKAG